ncbi:MAG: hypothetical protein ABF479_10005 [Gluconacetobacter sp.]
MRDAIEPGRPDVILLRFPEERRIPPTVELIRELLPDYAVLYTLLACHGLDAPPLPTVVEAQGRAVGMKMLDDVTLSPDARTAREEVIRWFQPLVERMTRRLTELLDMTWRADRQIRDGIWDEAFQIRAARTTMIAWRTGTRLLAAWSVLDEALIAHADASMGRIEQQASR